MSAAVTTNGHANLRPLENFLSLLSGVHEDGRGSWKALCPIHELDGQSHNPSLRVTEADDGKVLIYCHVCGESDIGPRICNKFGISIRALFPNYGLPTSKSSGRGQIVTTYSYHDERGELLYQVCRMQPKDFRQRRPKPGGGWDWSTKGTRRVPYRLQGLIAADPSSLIVIAEGEKDCDRLTQHGFIATCNAGGASKNPQKPKWPKSDDFNTPLAGRNVAIIADNDETGRAHALAVAMTLHGLAATVKVIDLPGIPLKGDASDWFDAGGTAEQLREIIEAAPVFAPSDSTGSAANAEMPDDGPLSFLSNAEMDEEGEWSVARSMIQILSEVDRLANGWPRRVGSALFVPATDGVAWLESSEGLFGWIGSHSPEPARFKAAAGFHTKAEVFAELRRTATDHVAIETIVHEPPLSGHYYAIDPPEIGDGQHLQRLLDRFCPATDVDRDLIQAAMMTLIWGGPGGTRPAFVVTADEGRGSGKSKTVGMFSELIGGHIELSANEDAGVIRQRLLSPDGFTKRLALLDNVKSFRFSCAELEALITASIISGKRMYVGEAQRPNTLVWFITLNGVSLSTDLAQRCVLIKVKRPVFDPLWEESTRSYIREHREEIIGDIVAALRANRYPLAKFSRWGAWERDVLSRVPDPTEAQAVIAERQKTADVESEESAIIEDSFRWKLKELSYDTDTDRVFIHSILAAAWLNGASGERMTTTSASRKLRQLIEEGTFRHLVPTPNHHHGRGFHWVGDACSPDAETRVDIEQRISRQSAERRGQF